jgi:hypothetical protein
MFCVGKCEINKKETSYKHKFSKRVKYCSNCDYYQDAKFNRCNCTCCKHILDERPNNDYAQVIKTSQEKHLKIFANKITKLPEKIIIPGEYIGSFI